MRKYLYSFKMYLLTSFQYRFDTLLGLVMSNISIFITIAFWVLVYRSNGTGVINGYTIADMVTFFAASSLFRTLILNGGGFEISGMIKSGDLSKVIIKPYSINMFLYWKYLSPPCSILQTVLIFAVDRAFSLHSTDMGFIGARSPSSVNVLATTTVISHLIWLLLGMTAFWRTGASRYVVLCRYNKFPVGDVYTTGLFSRWIVRVLELIPFAAFSYMPAKPYESAFCRRVLACWVFMPLWVLALMALNTFVWKAGTKKYSAIGG